MQQFKGAEFLLCLFYGNFNSLMKEYNAWQKNVMAVFTNRVAFIFIIVLSGSFSGAQSQILYVGTAEEDITPALPTALTGQSHLRIADSVQSPLVANIIAIESMTGKRGMDTAVFVAADLVDIPPAYLYEVRNEVGKLLPGFNVNKIIITATHTHSAPVMDTFFAHYPVPKNITQPEAYAVFFVQQVSRGIVKAWKSKAQATVSWGLTHAVIGYNRRSVYADGTAAMYGSTSKAGFMGMEGSEDHDVNTLFFWNKRNELIATCINVACPAQQTENGSSVSADYWHEVRTVLRKRLGKQLGIIGWIAAAGDQSPHVMYRFKADQRMHKLSGKSRLEEIGGRISDAVVKAYEIVKSDQYENPEVKHYTEVMELPMRIVTTEEYINAKNEHDIIAAKIAANPKEAEKIKVNQYWHGRIIQRFENQQAGNELNLPTEVHIVRIGDIAICTNPFELFTEYGIRIQGRSKALQTFVVQLAGESSYLPTEKAEKGGGYSAVVQSNPVGSVGGQLLVDRTVYLINEIMTDRKMPELK